MKKTQLAIACIIAIALSINAKGQNVSSSEYQGIKIYEQNPWYWDADNKAFDEILENFISVDPDG